MQFTLEDCPPSQSCLTRQKAYQTTGPPRWRTRGPAQGPQGWRVHIQRKAEKDKPLSACQERRNTRIARVRARVEHVFATMDQMGGKLLRCVGLDRADFLLTGKAAAYNLRRLCSLKAHGVAAF